MVEMRETRKMFTVDQANAMLPLVSAITADLVELAGDVAQRRERLESLTTGRSRTPGDPYTDELIQMDEDLQRDAERLQEYIEELEKLGVEPKSATAGLIDFPTVISGRPAYLCWQLGEPEVAYWHEIEAGYAGRRPLGVRGAQSRRTGLEKGSGRA